MKVLTITGSSQPLTTNNKKKKHASKTKLAISTHPIQSVYCKDVISIQRKT